jgi:AraC family transcriptional regulator, transcriptional activator of pobA
MNYHTTYKSDFIDYLHTDGMMVYAIEGCSNVLQTYSRRNYYKISLLTGKGIITYGNQSIEINGSVLLITKPDAVCTWNLLATHGPSYACVITREFLGSRYFRWVDHGNLFSNSDAQVYNLNFEESRFLGSLFQKMIDSQRRVYPYRDELIRDQVCVLLHTALSMKSSENYVDSVSTLKPMRRHIEFVEMRFPPEAQVLHYN